MRAAMRGAARGVAVLGVLCALCLPLFAAQAARAEVAEAEAQAHARLGLIALRVLAYDKNLAARAPGGEVSIVVVSGASQTARSARARWVAGFALVPKVKVGGRAVRVHAVDFESERAFDAAVAAHRAAAVIALPDLSEELPAVSRVARARKALSIAQRESALRQGIAVGLIASDEKDEIAINLRAARAEGVRFDAGLLALARLVDGGGR